ncbi:MAG TPA: acyl-CoA dehydrogenase family protein [Candidatus Binataceae bacterium]|nr:acyl-CoA dehydrogenase family protein [Candidatus Binataceae bacterium]
MGVKFPVERAEKRRFLLEAVANVRDTLAAHAEEGETLRTLPPASVAALTDSGLFAMKCPAELGGAEADPVTQIEVIEATSYIDPSAGWCLSICNGTVSVMGSCLPQEAIERLFAGDRPPRVAGSLTPGKAIPVEGGYRVNGRWSWASGIRHAEWIGGLTSVELNGGGAAYPRMMVFPVAKAQIHDNWNVAGLKGTGSCDFSVTDLFVPEAFTFNMRTWEPKRGGPLYQLGLPGLVVNEMAGFALGVGRRALDTIIDLAKTKRRGYGKQTPLAEREVFQRTIGECDLRLKAVRGLAFEVFERAWATVCAGQRPTPQLQVEMRTITTLVTDVALDVTTKAFRYGAGSAIHLNNILQRCLRDLQVEAAHLFVSDSTYELYGQCLLGIREVDPMG